MTKSVSANEAKNTLGSLLRYVNTEGDDVIVNNRGEPRAVIISFDAYREVQALREQKRRADALDALRQLRIEVRSQNADLTTRDADEISNRMSSDIIDSLTDDRDIDFERDHQAE